MLVISDFLCDSTSVIMQNSTADQLRQWDNDHVWHPFTPMEAYQAEGAPIIESGDGFELIDVEGNRYLDGISALWCNVHGHNVPEINLAIQNQLGKIAHTTLLGMSSSPSIELAKRLVDLAPKSLTRVFYSDSGSTAVEAALKIAWQYHRQKPSGPEERDLFGTVSGAYHGDTIGSVSVGSIELFHQVYGKMLFQTVSVPSPASITSLHSENRDRDVTDCFDQVRNIIEEYGSRMNAFVIEPLVQGAAGILVHPPGYLQHVRELTQKAGILLICDEVAVGFGRTGTMFACEQEDVEPDLMCLAKGLTGGYLPVAVTMASEEIFSAFLGDPSAGRTFFHGHTFTGNPLGCAAALASLDLLEKNSVLENSRRVAEVLREELQKLDSHPHVAEIRQKGTMVGIELVRSRTPLEAYSSTRRTGHLVTLAARKRGVILRPLGDTVVLMPAPAMPEELVRKLCRTAIESIEEATAESS